MFSRYSFVTLPNLFASPFSVEVLYILHALPSQTVYDFLSQRHNKLCHFISDVMGSLLAGEDQQQTNQPYQTGA